jgi:Putative zinc-finger
MNERCARITERLSAYLDGELDAAAAAEVEAHLAACDGCAARLADWGAAEDALAGGMPDRPESEWEGLASRVDAAIEREVADVARAGAAAAGAADPPTPSWWHRRRFALGSAATLVAALLIAVLQPWWNTETPHTVPAHVPVGTFGEPAPVLSPPPDDEAAAESEERSEADPQSGGEPARPGGTFAGKEEGTLGETLRSAARPPTVTIIRDYADTDAGTEAPLPVKREAPAAPPADLGETLRALGYVGTAPPERAEHAEQTEEEAPRSSAVTPQPEPSRERRRAENGPAGATGKSLYRTPPGTAAVLPRAANERQIRSEREWEDDLAQATRNALGTGDPQPSLALAREWDRFLATYPERTDVLDDRAAAWTRAARLGAPGACDEAPSRVDEWIGAAADDAERAAAQALRDELASTCP